MENRFILGIDTSNYKTSIAVTDKQLNIICDLRRFLRVKQGERGLRQSDALFQHIKNLPELIEEMGISGGCRFEAIAYSSKPRPAEGSYMPVFLAGESFARSLASVMGIPALAFSHQEGHIEAIKSFSGLRSRKQILACHFSGGTSELLKAADNSRGYDIEIIGGYRDIAFGQVIDRAGVLMGMSFPSGEEMDKAAMNAAASSKLLTPIKVRDAWLNLSGTDTQMKRIITDGMYEDRECLIRELFEKTAEAMVRMAAQGSEKTGIRDIIMAGGVTSSSFIRRRVSDALNAMNINAEFDDRGLAQDNAVGIAILGGRRIWQQNL